MATKVFLPEAEGTRLRELKTRLLNLVSNNEGITNEVILQRAEEAGLNPIDQELVDALLAGLQRDAQVELYP